MAAALLFAASPPAGAQEQVWMTAIYDGGAGFSYSYPESDGSTVAFSCEAGTGAVAIASFIGTEGVAVGAPATIGFSAGGMQWNVDGYAFNNEMDGQVDVEAEMTLDEEFATLFSGDELLIETPGASERVPLDGAAAAFAEFAAVCSE
jgi:hypothetical protein